MDESFCCPVRVLVLWCCPCDVGSQGCALFPHLLAPLLRLMMVPTEKKYKDAIQLYTLGLERAPSAPAVLLANRALCHLRLENFGSAILDASASIEVDPKYAKAYYRRASGNFGLGKYKTAARDFRQVLDRCVCVCVCVFLSLFVFVVLFFRLCKQCSSANPPTLCSCSLMQVVMLAPRDRNARVRYTACQKQAHRVAFEKAIAGEKQPTMAERLNIDEMGRCMIVESCVCVCVCVCVCACVRVCVCTF
jgi:hypothetical protein